MFIHLRNKRGQSTLEYGVVIAVIVGALIATQIYVKRALQGKARQSADDIGEQFAVGKTTGTKTVTSSATSIEEVSGGNQPTTNAYSNQTQNRINNENTPVESEEKWTRQ